MEGHDMKRILLFLLPGLFLALNSAAQTTLIFSENFEGSTNQVNLNINGAVGNNIGNNTWIVNNLYNGAGILPNTISQDSTFGGVIFSPNGNYLHIHDSVIGAQTGVANASYNPSSVSDRFSAVGNFCTLGYTNVKIVFYYLCEGDTNNAYGELYYSADNGPWLPANTIQYRSTRKWKYEEVVNPAFNNVANLRFGFRWQNNQQATLPKTSFSIDDIRVVGDFDPNLVGMEIDSVVSSPVCQGSSLLIWYSLDAPLCGTGFYQFELSNALTGTFANATNLGIFQINNLNTVGAVFVTIPANALPNNCYYIRMSRIDVVPAIIGDTSNCIEVILCPNTITTLPPVVTTNPLDTLCVGSVIDIPFYSTGVFVNNTYVAQLSDSNGVFPTIPNILGTFVNSQTYDPAQGSLPGSVSGLVVPGNQPIPPGCNYYIRIISISPAAIGSTYGPFCIRECDIETNDMMDLQACLTPTEGFDTLVSIQINSFDSTVVYDSTNVFQLQVLNSQSFTIINTGVLGSVQATGDTVVQLSVPVSTLLGTVGLAPGMYYLRVVASSSNQSWNTLGTLVRLTIGVPNPTPLSVLAYNPNPFTGYVNITDSAVCLGDAIYFTLSPYNPNSSYVWALNNDPNWTTEPFHGLLFNSSGTFNLSVIETNFGCVGPGSDTAVITVRPFPAVGIAGPAQICQGDTGLYSCPLQSDTYYDWSITNGLHVDTLNNAFEASFPNPGSAVIQVVGLNECGTATGTRTVIVRPLPDVDAGPDRFVCPGEEVFLATKDTVGYRFEWTINGDLVSQDSSLVFTPNDTTQVELLVYTYPNLNGGCKSFDTVRVNLRPPGPSASRTDSVCVGQGTEISAVSQADSYEWNTGEVSASINVPGSGIYTVETFSSARCAGVDTIFVVDKECPDLTDSLFVPNVFTPNGAGGNDVFRFASKNVEIAEVIIFDRWGLQVGEFSGEAGYWDGKHYKSGLDCPAGTYYYIARVKRLNQNFETLTGFISLMR
jgi:gliding motility-associated-like protein